MLYTVVISRSAQQDCSVLLQALGRPLDIHTHFFPLGTFAAGTAGFAFASAACAFFPAAAFGDGAFDDCPLIRSSRWSVESSFKDSSLVSAFCICDQLIPFTRVKSLNTSSTFLFPLFFLFSFPTLPPFFSPKFRLKKINIPRPNPSQSALGTQPVSPPRPPLRSAISDYSDSKAAYCAGLLCFCRLERGTWCGARRSSRRIK
jgi:hypothetical protein